MYRATDGRALAGVASGLANHLRVPVLAVRIVFVALVLAYGMGVILYAAFWAVLPVSPTTRTARRDTGQLVALAALGIGLLTLSGMVGWGGSTTFLLGLLAAVIAVGAGVIWHQADPERRRRLEEAGVPDMSQVTWIGRVADGLGDRRAMFLRFGGGALLVGVGIIGVIAVASAMSGGPIHWQVLLNGLLFALIAAAGITVVFGPLLWRSMGALRTEREARIRETERAEIAAMVHDQVLHTLALIQRNSQDSREVLRLARGQERTLRNWLYKPTASPTEKLNAALEEASAEVEDSFAISVDTVVVGDCDVDPDIAALVAAAREAMVNAGKHAGVQTISLYAEVEPEQVSVFVRDRGAGFDPAAVKDDRHGLQGSIIGRMERHHGKVEVRSTPGEGTEIRLYMPRSDRITNRAAGARQASREPGRSKGERT
ncbi:MAG: PspC domain-containing protein [Actinocatenispora sp.]